MEIRNLERKTLALVIAAVIFCSLFSTVNVFAIQDNSQKFVPNKLIIKFNRDISESDQADVIQRSGAQIGKSIDQLGTKVLIVPQQSLNGIMNALQHVPGVQYVQYDYLYEEATLPNDQYFATNQLQLNTINAPAAWDITKGSSNVVIAILDTGFDPTHPDLASKYTAGYNSVDGSNNFATSTCSHGTKVAGVAAAITDNGVGVAGLAWNNPIMPVKVTDDQCLISSSSMMDGIVYAADHGAKVVNLSFSIYGGDQAITDAAKYMYDKGGWVVASSGNTGALHSDPDNNYIISVGATDNTDNLATFSTYGPFVDFVAPGWGLYTTTLNGGYASASGTSVSSPLVAGLVALIFSQNPSATPDQVYDIIKQSAVDKGDPGRDDKYGWGRIDAGAALKLESSGTITITSSTTSSSTTPSSTATTPTTITPPAAPVITNSSTLTNNITPVISGTAIAGLTVKVYDSTTLLGSVIASTDGTWSFTTSILADGIHTITATATDSAGNTSTASNSITITINTTTPSVSITSPSNNAYINTASPKITGSASDPNDYVAGVLVTIDGNPQSVSSTTAWSTWSTTTTGLAQGSHTISVTAKDSYGNISTPVTSTFTIDTTAPTVSITNPQDGSTVKGGVTISTSASDISGISKVEIYIDGQLKSTITSTPYSYYWNAKGSTSGSHTITAKAYDITGNSASASITVNTSNRK